MVDMPQEWTAYPPDSDSGNWEIEDEYGHTATVYGEGEMAKAIALLVAAAPELLSACRQAVSAITYLLSNDDDDPGYADTLNTLAAAITKAEGRGE